MSVQKSYKYNVDYGVAGGLVDLTEHIIDTRNNESVGLRFGMGVVDGTVKGKKVILPVAASKKSNFEGVVVNSHAHEMDRDGEVTILKGETVNVLKAGRIFVRLADKVEPAYGDPVYLITDGDEAGYFTNEVADGLNAIKLNGHFIDVKASGSIAPVQIYVDKQDEATTTTDGKDENPGGGSGD